MAGSARAYPELYAALGGASAVPDLRGLFLRGYGSQAYAQNNGSTVGVTDTLHTSGSLGTVQGDAMRNITGNLNYVGGPSTPAGVQASGVFSASNQSRTNGSYGNTWWSACKFDVSRVVPTASESRPVNTAVRYLIRALP
jgi:hypothetical protein